MGATLRAVSVAIPRSAGSGHFFPECPNAAAVDGAVVARARQDKETSVRRVLDGPPMPPRGGENRDWRPLGVWVVLALVDGCFQQCHHVAVSNTNEAERHLPLQVRGVCSLVCGCALVHEVPFFWHVRLLLW